MPGWAVNWLPAQLPIHLAALQACDSEAEHEAALDSSPSIASQQLSVKSMITWQRVKVLPAQAVTADLQSSGSLPASPV
jgi:microcystin-dependent protein